MKQLVFRVAGGIHNTLYRWTNGRVGGHLKKAPVLLLIVRGRKSGKLRTTPLLYGRDGAAYVVIASKGGDPKHPAWYLNLRGEEADLRVGADTVHVRARDAEGDERDRLWAQMVELWPPYADYQRKTERRIPVVVLEPTS